MLLKKKPQEGSIVTVKLVTGDEVVGKLTEISDGVSITKPICIAMSPNGLAFVPFMLGAPEDATIEFKTSQVVACVEARKEIRDVYIQSTSGIVPASGAPEGLL